MGARHDADGLSDAEAARRLAAHGHNTLAAPERRSWGRIGADAAREPMFLLLAGAALLYLSLGQPGEGLFLCCMVGLSLGLSLYQEGKTERALAALRALASPRARVLRSGRWQDIAGADVVRGDLIVVNEGDRVPADARLVSSNGMQTDEALLSGESMPVSKRGSAMLFAGSLVLQGHGVARVTAIGVRSQIGRIAASLHGVRPAPSPLQRQCAALVRAFAVAGLTLSAALVLAHGILRGDWLLALLAGIALAMSMLPEELPVIMTVFPAIGAWRLARQHVLTRRLAALETLGAISVLCVDKTGTLTANRMDVVALHAHDRRHRVTPGNMPPDCATLVETARLASAAGSPDPIDQAVQRLAQASAAAPRPPWILLHEYGVSAQQPALVHVWRRTDARLLAAAKGAPETILGWCRLDPAHHALALAAAAALARDGLRVLAVAHGMLDGDSWPARAADLALGYDGLLALADPLRPDIPDCVAQCRQAGIRVVMITGDHPDTAHAIALQAGLDDSPALTGNALDALDAPALAARLATLSVCARIAPGQKLRLVQAYVRSGTTVAMTGDGVNDAPALKAAHVGIAMGARGTDVAREAAALVLLDDRFASIVEAIRAGRRIHDNMLKSMRYIISVHAPIAGMAMLPILAGWPPLLFPMQIVFLQMIIDPACALVFEHDPAAPQLMQRPARDPRAPLFDVAGLFGALALGALPCAAVAAAYAWALGTYAPKEARALGFTVLVMANLALILANRAAGVGLWASLRQPNRMLWGVAGATLAMLTLALYQPWLATVFQFGPLAPATVAAAAALGLASALVPALLVRPAEAGTAARKRSRPS